VTGTVVVGIGDELLVGGRGGGGGGLGATERPRPEQSALALLRAPHRADEQHGEHDEHRARYEVNEDDAEPVHSVEVHLNTTQDNSVTRPNTMQ